MLFASLGGQCSMACRHHGAFLLCWLVGCVPSTVRAKDVVIDDTAGLGMHFQGVGAISGGGATSRMLADYNESIVSDILDFLFKPNFGASLHLMKVEIGGDSDSTEGCEASHMHTEGEENYERGYEWWMMKQARARNPEIQLYGLSWSWPGWLGGKPSPDRSAATPFADIDKTVNYTMSWIEGAQTKHGITVDHIGLWNERNSLVPESYHNALQKALDERAPHVSIASGPHYPGTGTPKQVKNCSALYEWNETRMVDEEGSVADGRSARCLARCMNRQYLTDCRTGIYQWHLISSFYDYLSYPRAGIAVAREPWSGNYEITSPTWAVAHTTQFSRVGWRYLALDNGVGFLDDGGSYVTRMDPVTKEFSIVLEKIAYKDSECARQLPLPLVPYTVKTEDVVLKLSPSMQSACGGKLYMWVSDLTEGNNSTELFINKGEIALDADGEVTVHMTANLLVTLTSNASAGHKGSHGAPPASTRFPTSHNDSFDASASYSAPRYWADEMGAWEVQEYTVDPSRGKVMAQVAPAKPVAWKPVQHGPRSFFGDGSFGAPLTGTATGTATGTRISFDVMLRDEGEITLSGGPALKLNTAGTFQLGKDKGSAAFKAGNWSTVQYDVCEDHTTAQLDGKLLANVTVKQSGGWKLQLDLSRYIYAYIDNFNVEQYAY